MRISDWSSDVCSSDLAELGVAAHWRYKEGGGADAGFERKIAWMRQLLEGRDGDDDSALVAGLSSDLIEDRVYVLTPRGEVIDLPRGGTVLDFAYHVHTEHLGRATCRERVCQYV